MGEAAAEGSARADGVVGDMGQHRPQQGAGDARDRPARDVHMADQGADLDHAARFAEMRQLADPIEIDEMAGTGQAKRHHRRKALTARNQPRILIGQLMQKRGHLREGGGAMEGEWSGLQILSPRALLSIRAQPLLIHEPCQTDAPKSERIAHRTPKSINFHWD